MYVFIHSYSLLLLNPLHQVLTKDEGGRANPFMAEYKPQLFLRTANITVSLLWPEGTADAEDKMVRIFTHVNMSCIDLTISGYAR